MTGLAVLLGHAAAAQEQASVAVVGDVAVGEGVFRRCQACHEVGEGAAHGVGPILNGVLGRPAGSAEGFEYSDALREAGEAGLVWTVEDLNAFLERPRDKVPGTAMSFVGLRSEEDRNDVIAYIVEASPGNEEE